jgi:hypothetical protein
MRSVFYRARRAGAARALRCRRSIHYKKLRSSRLKADFTVVRDLGPTRMRMAIRGHFDPIERAAGQARPAAVLVLRGLLLLIAP